MWKLDSYKLCPHHFRPVSHVSVTDGTYLPTNQLNVWVKQDAYGATMSTLRHHNYWELSSGGVILAMQASVRATVDCGAPWYTSCMTHRIPGVL